MKGSVKTKTAFIKRLASNRLICIFVQKWGIKLSSELHIKYQTEWPVLKFISPKCSCHFGCRDFYLLASLVLCATPYEVVNKDGAGR